MKLFYKIDDAEAIVRLPKGVFKQVSLYRRGDRVFVPHGGGYVRLVAKFGEEWGTSHPDVKAVELPSGVPNLVVSNPGSSQPPRWTGAQ